MKEHGISFSPDMIRALLDGRKTQTRRITPRKIEPGDRIWVKEALTYEVFDRGRSSDIRRPACYAVDGVYVWATKAAVSSMTIFNEPVALYTWKNKALPAMFMPKWAARIWLEVTEVRMERLQDISEEDAIAEGIVPHPVKQGFPARTGHIDIIKKNSTYGVHSTLKSCYAHLWNSLHPDVPYSSNPTVQVITFKRIER